MKLLKVLLVLTLSSLSLSGLAETNTVVSIKKITTLTGTDADGFQKVFGSASISTPDFSIHTTKQSCEISASRAGFSGELAKKLLSGRKEAVFVSKNEKFKLQCGISNVPFCNVIQRNGILE